MKKLICKTCGSTGKPKMATPGSFFMEVFLWLLFLVPGLLYSFWRIFARYPTCAKCGSRELIPLDSPMGKELALKMRSSSE